MMINNNKIKILYCEDEAVTRKMAILYMNLEKYEHYIAQDGAEGFELYKKHKPDIVITDISMPKMTGIELIENINKCKIKKPHIIMTTSNKEFQFILNAIKLGVNNFILKPLDLKQIASVFTKTLDEVIIGKELELQKTFNQIILDFQDNLLITFHNNQIINANKSFLSFFDCETLNEFTINYQTLSKNIILENNEIVFKDDEDFLQRFLVDNTKNKIKILNRNNYEIRTFLIKYTNISIFENEILLSLTDITEIEEESKKFELQATTDVLTKIYNRLKFHELLDYEIARYKRYDISFSIIMFDIDKFKTINDTYGHMM